MHLATGENHALMHTGLKEIALMERISRLDWMQTGEELVLCLVLCLIAISSQQFSKWLLILILIFLVMTGFPIILILISQVWNKSEIHEADAASFNFDHKL